MTAKKAPNNFDDLYMAWTEILSAEELNKRFYRRLSDWYLWAVGTKDQPQVMFPVAREVEQKLEERHKLNQISVIRSDSPDLRLVHQGKGSGTGRTFQCQRLIYGKCWFRTRRSIAKRAPITRRYSRTCSLRPSTPKWKATGEIGDLMLQKAAGHLIT